MNLWWKDEDESLMSLCRKGVVEKKMMIDFGMKNGDWRTKK